MSKKELQKLETRRLELAAEVEAARDAVVSARDALISGKASNQTLVDAQGAFNALESACDDLSRQIETLQAEIQAQADADDARARRAQLLARLSQLATEAENTRGASVAAYDECIGVLRRNCGAILENGDRLNEMKAEFDRLSEPTLVSELEAGGVNFEAVKKGGDVRFPRDGAGAAVDGAAVALLGFGRVHADEAYRRASEAARSRAASIQAVAQ
jgi:chromosome segregation ATPase